MSTPVLETLGDTALLLRWGEYIEDGVVQRVQATARALRADAPVWVLDVVPAYASVAVFIDAQALAFGLPIAIAEAWCLSVAAAIEDSGPDPGRRVEIPVRYGGADGPDLVALAASAGLDVDEVIARHTAPEYRVAMLGFAPGFPYLLGLDPVLATARHAQPRTRVPAGSVGIGGAQTGVYPRASPAGWQIIGRTQAVLFDATRKEPSLLQPGDRVRFVPQP